MMCRQRYKKRNRWTITFLSPEHYPHSLKVGMRLVFQDGSKIAGYAEILEIYNELLKM